MSDQIINKVMINWNKVAEDSYLRQIEAISGVEEIIFDHAVTFFVGENGSGKSTLLEAIAVAFGFNPEGGTKNYLFSTYDSHSELHQAIRFSRGLRNAGWGYFYRAESFYNTATKEEEYGKEWGGTSHHYHNQSHGESLLSLVQNTFRANGMYLMDEPEAALSPQRQLTLLIELHRLAKAGAQFIIATHSPILTGLPEAQILDFDNGKIHPCAYEETDCYRVTSMFLQHREQIMKQLLKE